MCLLFTNDPLVSKYWVRIKPLILWLPFLTESEIKVDLLQETSSEAPARVNHSHLDPQNILSMVLLANFYYSYA